VITCATPELGAAASSAMTHSDVLARFVTVYVTYSSCWQRTGISVLVNRWNRQNSAKEDIATAVDTHTAMQAAQYNLLLVPIYCAG
jgi:hypothetical protein